MSNEETLNDWLDALAGAVTSGSFVKLQLSKPTREVGDLTSIDLRAIMVKRALKLSFTYHHQTRDVVKNHAPADSLPLLRALLQTQFTAARLYTLEADLHLSKHAQGFQLTRHPPTQHNAPPLSHDRPKQRLIESQNKPYLHALGITDAKGNVYKATQDKFRQINKYIEILDGLIRPFPKRETLRIVDMGAGKGYLTFALYDHLVNTRMQPVTMVGVEYRAELVQQCNAIAQQAGFTGLTFTQGSIADYDCSDTDVVIALHACDTATDDAIRKAIRAGAALIVVAPCCHKQIRRATTHATDKHPLGFLMEYGTYAERIAEMVTDGMRAQLMQLYGYGTNIFEFISDAHTPKNVMIVAVKSANPASAAQMAQLHASLAATKAQFGITHHRLEQLLAAEANK